MASRAHVRHVVTEFLAQQRQHLGVLFEQRRGSGNKAGIVPFLEHPISKHEDNDLAPSVYHGGPIFLVPLWVDVPRARAIDSAHALKPT